MKTGAPFLQEDLDAILNPDKKLSENEQLVKKQLYYKYPRKFNKKELERIKERELMETLEAEFQKMYGLEEEDDD